MRTPGFFATIALAALTACGHGGAATAPKGWAPMPGASDAWSTGSGPQTQQYRYTRANFAGTIADLSSTVTIDVLLHHRGARLRGSVTPFAPCPGSAAVATFSLPDGSTLQAGFTLRNGRAVRVTYLRPSGTPADANVPDAMREALCITPG